VNWCEAADLGCTCIGIGWSGVYPIWYPNEGVHGQILVEYTSPIDVNVCPYEEAPMGGPIVIDLEGGDFVNAFTDVEHGVIWDFFGTNAPVRMSWTNPKRNIGFLVLDRNQDGIINNSHEMFGNLTNQPLSEDEKIAVMKDAEKAHAAGKNPTPFPTNGFRALAVFDQTSKGGNNDGKLDEKDSIWSLLRIWVDTCQNANSQCGKIYTLDELGITSISLKYVSSDRTDQYGNKMKYEGSLTMRKAAPTAPKIYDVYFVTRPFN
jgi:hypothetical protein